MVINVRFICCNLQLLSNRHDKQLKCLQSLPHSKEWDISGISAFP